MSEKTLPQWAITFFFPIPLELYIKADGLKKEFALRFPHGSGTLSLTGLLAFLQAFFVGYSSVECLPRVLCIYTHTDGKLKVRITLILSKYKAALDHTKVLIHHMQSTCINCALNSILLHQLLSSL